MTRKWRVLIGFFNISCLRFNLFLYYSEYILFFIHLRVYYFSQIFNLFIDTSFILTKPVSGEIIYDLRKKIQEIKYDLNQLDDYPSEIPELITSANLLRSNEFLSKINEKKTELVSVYEEYSEALEAILSSVFEIQKDLKEILKTQSSMIDIQEKKSLKSKNTKK